MSQVDYLVNGKVGFPSVVLVKLVNYEGRPLEHASLKVTMPGGEPTSVDVDASGVALLTKFKEGVVGDIVFSVTANSRTGTLVTPTTTFSDLLARGNKAAISVDLPFNLPVLNLSEETNLAQGKPVKDSANSFPAQLVGLVDENPDTTYTLAPNGWVEVDLGRDRMLGEITFSGDVPKKFRVLTYGTTDKVEQADWWIDEIDSDRFRREYEGPGDLSYRPTPNTSRYVRILNLSDKPAVLKGIKIYPSKII